IVGGYPWWMDV
nr:Chain P, ZAP.14 [synthetic construct]